MKNILENKYLQHYHITAVGIQVIQKKVSQQDHFNVHHIHHVHIVIVNNVHHLIIIKNLLKIHQEIHQRQIQQLIKISIHQTFIIVFFNKNNLYQLVDLIHILNHYLKQQLNLQYNKNELEQLQQNDEDIYLVIVHFGQEHKHNNLLI